MAPEAELRRLLVFPTMPLPYPRKAKPEKNEKEKYVKALSAVIWV